MDMGRELLGLCDLLRDTDRAEVISDIDAGLRHGYGAGRARLWSHLHHGGGGPGDIPGQTLRQYFRHRDACSPRRRCGRSLGYRHSPRPFREVYDRLCDRYWRERTVWRGDLARVPPQDSGGRRAVAPDTGAMTASPKA